MNQNIIQLKCIDELLNEKFFIPDFQRGYRWSPEDVNALLNDIWKFRADSQNAESSAFYCLQPLVVAKSENRWILIDGQQRLTTIRLILKHLHIYMTDGGKTNFHLSYQTRPDSELFLENPSEEKAKECPDYYHIYEAYKTIREWFDRKGSGTTKQLFFSTLLSNNEQGKNVKFIWYEVPPDDSANQINIFTRLNIGKIRLTNAELIKALLLQKNNFSKEHATLKQIQIATEWDVIEQKLHQQDFWHFLYREDGFGPYENRIEFIFDLMQKRTKESELYHTFNEFYQDVLANTDISKKTKIEQIWLSIKEYFQVFEEWYSDRDIYHMIGFLVYCGVRLPQLKDKSLSYNKKEFKAYLKKSLASFIDYDVRELDYSDANHREKIRRALLLFNIHTLMITSEADLRFPFHRFKSLRWDIEHIRSQTDKLIKGVEQKKEWLSDVFYYFTGEGISNWLDKRIEESQLQQLGSNISDFCQRILNVFIDENSEQSSFDDLKKDIEEYFKEGALDEESLEITHSIGNLALLNDTINRSYKNAMFPIKRKKIIEYDEKGVFVPISTKNVFLKYYSKKFDEIMYWSNDDAKAYAEAIFNTIELYRN